MGHCDPSCRRLSINRFCKYLVNSVACSRYRAPCFQFFQPLRRQVASRFVLQVIHFVWLLLQTNQNLQENSVIFQQILATVHGNANEPQWRFFWVLTGGCNGLLCCGLTGMGPQTFQCCFGNIFCWAAIQMP